MTAPATKHDAQATEFLEGPQMTDCIHFQAHSPTSNWRGPLRESFGLAATDQTIHMRTSEDSCMVRGVCPNCGQWRNLGDCVNECARRGFAPAAGPSTLNL
jgi:hypothetical protein